MSENTGLRHSRNMGRCQLPDVKGAFQAASAGFPHWLQPLLLKTRAKANRGKPVD
jgi:hypothetical protein